MSEIKTCICGRNDWQWQLGDKLTSWIRCKNCGWSMFGPDIGVILINWDITDFDRWTLSSVLAANQDNEGVVEIDR